MKEVYQKISSLYDDIYACNDNKRKSIVERYEKFVEGIDQLYNEYSDIVFNELRKILTECNNESVIQQEVGLIYLSCINKNIDNPMFLSTLTGIYSKLEDKYNENSFGIPIAFDIIVNQSKKIFNDDKFASANKIIEKFIEDTQTIDCTLAGYILRLYYFKGSICNKQSEVEKCSQELVAFIKREQNMQRKFIILRSIVSATYPYSKGSLAESINAKNLINYFNLLDILIEKYKEVYNFYKDGHYGDFVSAEDFELLEYKMKEIIE